METTTNRLSSAKWSRNLNKDCQSEANRLRLLERQRQLIESKLQRRQQQEHQNATLVTSAAPSTMSRPATSIANLRASNVSRRNSSTADEFDGDDAENAEFDDNIVHNKNAISGRESRSTRARTSVPSSRTLISSLDTTQPVKLETTLSNKNSNINGENKSNIVGQLSSNNKTYRDNIRSMSKSEANLKEIGTNLINANETTAADQQAQINERQHSLTPNPLKTVLTDDELLKFVSQPISPDVTLQCTIIRDKKGLDRSLYPTYYMHLQDIVQNNLTSKSLGLEGSKSLNNISNNGKIEGTATVWMSDSFESINSNDDTDQEADVTPKMLDPIDINSIGGNAANTSAIIGGNSSSRKVFVLSGRRRKKSKTYLIGNNAFDISRDRCIAKLKSNVLGTQFTAFRLHQNGVRYEISSVTYETNVLGFKGPRKMSIIIPKPDEKTNVLCNLSLQEELKRNSRAIMLLKNKTPIWNEETQSYVLNFHGRVTQASVKNFQLVVQENAGNRNGKHFKSNGLSQEIRRSASTNHLNQRYNETNFDEDDDEEDDDDDDDDENNDNSNEDNSNYKRNNTGAKLPPKTLSKSGYLTAYSSEDAKQIADTNELVSLQFGRVSNTHFSCDVSWPLSLLQAFAIALSSFDSKLACE